MLGLFSCLTKPNARKDRRWRRGVAAHCPTRSAFLGGLRALVAAIPPDHRAAVMSAFYIVAYLSGSATAVLAGLVVRHLGLQTTFEIFGSIVAAIALVVAFEAWRTRPRSRVSLRIVPEPAKT
jgi:predicted MFS family arabinose efflux permease